MPATVNAGDLLVTGCAVNGLRTFTTPTGWSIQCARTALTNASSIIYVINAAGTEGGTTVDVVTDSGANMVAHTFRVTGWGGTLGTDIASGTPATGSSTAPNPPSASWSWGSLDILSLVFAGGLSATTQTVSSYPTSYTGGTLTAQTNGVFIASAQRALTAAASPEDPATYTVGFTTSWIANTVVIVARSNVTVTPGVLALTLSGFAPAIKQGVVPSPLALTLTGFAPAMGLSVVPAQLGLTLTGFAPVLSQNIIPGVLALTLTGFAPVLPKVVIPAPLVLTLSGFAPVLQQAVVPSPLALTLTGFAPSIPVKVTPGVLALSLTGYAPLMGRGVIPGPLVLVLTGYAPTLITIIGPATIDLAVSKTFVLKLAPDTTFITDLVVGTTYEVELAMSDESYVGNSMTVDATFTRRKTGDLVDPTTVTTTVETPAGVKAAYVYGTDANLTRTSLGLFSVTYTTDADGWWIVKFVGTGQVVAVNQERHHVLPVI